MVGLAGRLRVFAAACFLPAFLITFLISGVSSSVLSVAVAAEKDATILVRQALPTFTITLQSNPSTGYSWFLESFDTGLLESVLHRYLPPESTAAGAPGKEVWTFRARHGAFVVPRTSRIVFRYLRPWAAGDAPGESIFTVVFVPGK
jgi:predicted secreted protein